VYSESGRKKWTAGLPEAARYVAEILYAELDALMVLREHAEKEMVSEAGKHSERYRQEVPVKEVRTVR
jgi:hypothetical protein